MPTNIDPRVAHLRAQLANAIRHQHDEDAERLRRELAEAFAAAKRREAIALLIADAAHLLPEDVDRLLNGLLLRKGGVRDAA